MSQPEEEQPQHRDLKEFNELRIKSDHHEDLSVIGLEGELREPITPAPDWHEELAQAEAEAQKSDENTP